MSNYSIRIWSYNPKFAGLQELGNVKLEYAQDILNTLRKGSVEGLPMRGITDKFCYNLVCDGKTIDHDKSDLAIYREDGDKGGLIPLNSAYYAEERAKGLVDP